MTSENAVDTGVSTGTAGESTLLQQRFDIDPASPLVDLDRPSAKAFAARDRRDPARDLFALICASELPIRGEAASLLKGATFPGVMAPVACGPVYWPALERRCVAVAYECPRGGSLADGQLRRDSAISHHDFPRRVIEPLVKGLRAMERLGLSHRAIRPDNLFFLDEARENLALGDCVTAPAGFHQPALLEPIERSMASPAGRGEGGPCEDLYALGATLVLLLPGHGPIAELGDEELLRSRMENGTYASLCKSMRIPMALVEPLRGMLNDNPEERWGLAELELWLDGRRPTSPQRRARPKATVAFQFAGRDHFRPRTLAHAFTRNVRDAAKVIREGQLEHWLRRGIDSPALAKSVAKTTAVDGIRQPRMRGTDDLLVAEVAILLDPEAPIRFKGFSFMIDGFGPALAISWLNDGDGQTPAEILVHGLPGMWWAAQVSPDPRIETLQQRFSRLGAYVRREEIGYGLERCLYEANPGIPCQSPYLKEEHVIDVIDLLPALDAAAGRVDHGARPVDRHVAAFVAARFSHDSGPHLTALADPAAGKSLTGMLGLLALLQWRLKTPPVFALAEWVGGQLGPVIETYHGVSTRREIEQEIGQIIRQGSLPNLYDLVNNPEKRQSDERGFAVAVAAFAAAEREIDGIEKGEERRFQSCRRLGRRAAATAAAVISMVVIATALLVRHV
jgi:hypothetical protein